MRLLVIGAAFGGLLLCGASTGAQGTSSPSKFSGIKLVDFNARTPERTVTVTLGSDSLMIADPAAPTDVKTLPYSGLSVMHTVSSAPPKSAGDPSAAAKQPMAPPMYMGKDPRNWLTLKSGSDELTLRVSSKVYGQLKAALGEHNVTVEEAK
jgi:hypothetical protein